MATPASMTRKRVMAARRTRARGAVRVGFTELDLSRGGAGGRACGAATTGSGPQTTADILKEPCAHDPVLRLAAWLRPAHVRADDQRRPTVVGQRRCPTGLPRPRVSGGRMFPRPHEGVKVTGSPHRPRRAPGPSSRRRCSSGRSNEPEPGPRTLLGTRLVGVLAGLINVFTVSYTHLTL